MNSIWCTNWFRVYFLFTVKFMIIFGLIKLKLFSCSNTKFTSKAGLILKKHTSRHCQTNWVKIYRKTNFEIKKRINHLYTVCFLQKFETLFDNIIQKGVGTISSFDWKHSGKLSVQFKARMNFFTEQIFPQHNFSKSKPIPNPTPTNL